MGNEIKLTFLGTSAQIPSASRNHTAILLTFEGENILVDCGEGTQRQFRKAKLNPCKITRILITHWHGDHVFGLLGMMSSLALNGYNKTLYIYGPKHTKAFMNDLLKIFNFQKNYKIEIEEVEKSGKFFDHKDFYLTAEKMSHGIPTNAYLFVKKGHLRIDKKKLDKSKLPQGPLLQKLKQGKDIVYKGKKYLAKNLTFGNPEKKVSFVLDTKNNDKIVPFVEGADLLVCESSYHSELEGKAAEHLHLTSKQAAEIAKKAKVEKLVLTHISQRYEMKTKKILDDAKKVFKNSVLVNDFDEIEV